MSCVTGHGLSAGDLTTHLHGETLTLTSPQLLILPIPMYQAFKHMSLWDHGLLE